MKSAIYWFRNNLRLRDNPSLARAVENYDELLFVYILDSELQVGEHKLGFQKMGPYREKFLFESIEDLASSLQARGASLHIYTGKPSEVILQLAKDTEIKHVVASREIGHLETLEESAIREKLNLELYDDGFLYEPGQLPLNAKSLPRSFTGYRKKIEKKVVLRDEIPTPEVIKGLKYEGLKKTVVKVNNNVTHDPRSAHPFKGGEVSAWQRLNNYVWETRALGHYKQTRNKLIGTDYSCKMSAFLACGCISPVSIVHQVGKYESEYGSNSSTYWLVFELMWRDFFRLVSLKFGNKLFLKGGIQQKQIEFTANKGAFQKWCNGETGQPFVDANMKELVATGFMSNRGRQNAASYLFHNLRQDWRWGAAFYESQLVDYDCASNWGNWMYVSGVGNSGKSSGFDVEWQQQKYDNKGEYRQLWL